MSLLTDLISIKKETKKAELVRKKTTVKAKSGTGSKVYLKYTSKNKLLFPVTPSNISIDSPFGVNTIDVAHAGQFTTAGFRELKSIEFESFFPAKYNASYCTSSTIHSAEWYRKKVEAYRDKRKPLYLIVTDLKISMKVLVQDFSCEYKGGEAGDIYFTLKLVEYKSAPSTLIKKKKTTAKKKASTKKASTTKSRASSTKYSVKKGQTHTVRTGETLQKIAKIYYGTTSKWRDIYTINRAKIGANPNKIYPGQKLVIRKK